jgi:LacI family transcriptional regulator
MAVITDAREDRQRLARMLTHFGSRRVAGVITSAAREGDEEVLQELSDRGVPVVLAIRKLANTGLPSVADDDRLGGTLAARHLCGLGHRVVAQIPGPPDIEPVRERELGFSQTVAALGAMEIDHQSRATGFTVSEGRRLMSDLLEVGDGKLTGVFVHNDEMALGAFEALASSGLECPGDVSIVGYNDAFFAPYVLPPLTTVALPARQIGRLAGELVIRLAEQGGQGITDIAVAPKIVIRESSAAPRRKSYESPWVGETES